MTDPRPFLPAFLLEPGANALCAEVDPEAWFPEPGEHSRAAKRICNRCDLEDACLAWALRHDVEGVWGGASEQERRSLRGRKPLGRPLAPINHGTTGGYKAHGRRGEPACEDCLAANRLRNVERRARDLRRRGGGAA